jgi:hypothetical protein
MSRIKPWFRSDGLSSWTDEQRWTFPVLVLDMLSKTGQAPQPPGCSGKWPGGNLCRPRPQDSHRPPGCQSSWSGLLDSMMVAPAPTGILIGNRTASAYLETTISMYDLDGRHLLLCLDCHKDKMHHKLMTAAMNIAITSYKHRKGIYHGGCK